ncbi:hypothetical protein LIER_23033 [Lithospermum erythrorhizon]|uniref:Uncharacterized protein n=1 Tax=Lithospermum erythrorhizon TaxID=34254 RepID=A0AAV3QZ13_LITER
MILLGTLLDNHSFAAIILESAGSELPQSGFAVVLEGAIAWSDHRGSDDQKRIRRGQRARMNMILTHRGDPYPLRPRPILYQTSGFHEPMRNGPFIIAPLTHVFIYIR